MQDTESGFGTEGDGINDKLNGDGDEANGQARRQAGNQKRATGTCNWKTEAKHDQQTQRGCTSTKNDTTKHPGVFTEVLTQLRSGIEWIGNQGLKTEGDVLQPVCKLNWWLMISIAGYWNTDTQPQTDTEERETG